MTDHKYMSVPFCIRLCIASAWTYSQMHMYVYSTHLWVNAMIMLLGIIFFAIGTGLYAAASLGRGSYEALTFSLAEKNGWQVKKVRMILDILMVMIGVILGGKFGICTIATIIISGPIIQFTASKTKSLLSK